MKKIIAAILAVLVSSFVQKADAQLLDIEGMPPYKLGITAGVNVPSFSGGAFDYTLGWRAGLDLMVDGSDLLDNTFARVNLLYTMKGATGPDYYLAQGERTHYTSHYVEIPVHYGLAWAIDREWTLMAETGPYLAFGMGGTARPDNESLFNSHSFFNDHNASRFDFGWGIQTSVLFEQQWQLNLGYEWGFKNMNKYFLQNTGLTLGVTLYFEY